MSFLKSMGAIFSNRKNFKTWEQQQNDRLAQRKALLEKKPPSEEELKNAAKTGEVIIDVMNTMDGHSEDVAEKTESATEPIEGLIPIATFCGTGFAALKFILSPAEKKYTLAKKNFIKNNKNELQDCCEQIKKLAEKNNNIPKVWYGEDLLSNSKSFNKQLEALNISETKELYKRTKNLQSEFNGLKDIKGLKTKGILTAVIPIAATVVSFIAATLYATKLQVGSSKVARWQSREKLKDPKYFVKYTDKQIKEAENRVGDAEVEDKKKKMLSFIKKDERASLKDVLRDKKEYETWKKNQKDENNKAQRELTPEELIQAQKDQEVIQRVVKTINNKAEDYSENMETAAGVIIGGTPLLGAAVGGVTGWMLNKTGVVKKAADKYLDKFLTTIKDGNGETGNKIKETAKKLNSESSTLFDTLEHVGNMKNVQFNNGTNSGIIPAVKKAFAGVITTPKGRTIAIGAIGTAITGIAGLIIGLKLQKASARAGRYIAKKELESDPTNFIGFTDEELKTEENTKAKKVSAGKKFKEYVTFLPRVIKQYIEYKKYRKHELPKEKAIKEELIKMDVTDQQLNDAQNLQRKLFNTFEKVDDKSQDYSESMEAATTIAKPAAAILGMGLLLSPIIVTAVLVSKGKLTPSKVINKVTGWFKKHTNFLKGKKVNKYLSEVQQNIPSAIEKSAKKDGGPIIIRGKELKTEDLRECINTLKNPQGSEMLKEFGISSFDDAIAKVKEMSPDEFKGRVSELTSTGYLRAFSSTTQNEALSILENLKAINNNVPKEKLNGVYNELLSQIDNDPQKCIRALSNQDFAKNLLLTKSMKKDAALLGGAWAATSLGATYAVESYLAKLQKESGRLGVMNALDELKDPRYYANVNPEKKNDK